MNIDTDWVPEITTRFTHTPDAPDCDLELSVEDDAKIDRAAQWGASLMLQAKAHDASALAALRAIGLIRWEAR